MATASVPIALAIIVSFMVPAAASAARERPAPAETRDYKTWLEARAGELKGKRVVNPQGQALGKIEDLIIDARRSAVQYAVLSFGGIAGLGDKRYIFPLNAFTRGENRDRLVLNAEPKALREAPGFNRDNWPFAQPLRRASELRGVKVKDRSGNAAGKIDDLLVHLGSGHIERIVLAQKGRKASEGEQVLPLQAFTIARERGGEVMLASGERR